MFLVLVGCLFVDCCSVTDVKRLYRMSGSNYLDRCIGNYRIVELLGSGGFGSVYRGEHTILTDRVAAIKILHTYLDSVDERKRFLQEARLLANMQHPHILHIFDVGVDEGVPYLVAEYASHGSLRNLMKQYAPHILPIETSLSIITQIGQALEYAHQQNVIHRDLKPENILFDANGNVLLADFGVATQLTTSSVKHVTVTGTPSYMAPESFQGVVSKESDQYALACIAYELLTGQVPFTAPDFFAMGFNHLTGQIVALTHYNSALPRHIENAVLKAMAKKREERHADIHSFIAALNDFHASYDAPVPTLLQKQPSGLLPTYVPAPSPQSTGSHSPTPTISSNFHSPDPTLVVQQKAGETPILARQEPVTLPPFQHVGSDEHAYTLTQPSQFALHSSEKAARSYIQEPITPFFTQAAEAPNGYHVRQQDEVWQPFPPLPDPAVWNGEASYPGQKRTYERKWRMTAIVSAIAAIAIVASLLFAFLPSILAPRTITKTVYLSPNATATSATTTRTTPTRTTTTKVVATRTTASTTTSGPVSNPTATVAVTGGGSTPQPTSVPTQNPTALPTTTAVPTATPVPTATTAPTPTPTTAPTPTPTTTPVSETLQIAFVNATSNGWGTSTQNSYSGTVTITISGTGQADSTEWSDGFYIYTDTSGNPLTTPITARCWTLYINGATASSSVGLPSYNSSHTYTVYMTLSQPSTINFGVCDGQSSDNTGSYSITVQQS